MEFEWDEAKNRSNLEKHGISFEEASLIFDGPVLTYPDDRFEYGEVRWRSIGKIEEISVVAVIHTDRAGVRGSSPLVSPNNAKGDSTMPINEQRRKEIASIRDEDIDFSDIPELDEEWFKKAVLVQPDNKTQLTLRLDPDIVLWFRAQGRGYQTRMNAVLRAYYQSQSSAGKAPKARRTGTK